MRQLHTAVSSGYTLFAFLSMLFFHATSLIEIMDTFNYMDGRFHFRDSEIKGLMLYVAEIITKARLFKYTENFTINIETVQIKNSDIFLISAQNMDCGYSLEPPRRGGSNEYPQSKLLSRNKKNNVYPCKPKFYYIKVGFKGVEII